MNGGSRGAAELAAGRIDAMHVGLSSVIRLNRTGGDLRIVAALANVIRFTFFSGPSVKTAADLKGGAVGVSSFGSESDSTVTLALKRLGLSRDDVTLKEYGGSPKRLAAVKSGELKATAVNEPFSSMAREQGFNVLFDLVPGADPLAVHRHRGPARHHHGSSRRADAVHPRHRRGQLSRAHRREQGQGGAGQDRPTSPTRKSSTSATTTSSCSRRRTSSRATRPRKTFSRSSPMRARRSRTTSTAASSTALRKDGVFTALAQKYRR